MVIPAGGLGRSDVGTNGGRVAAIGKGISWVTEVLDANGEMVSSLIVDPHTVLFKGDGLMSLFERNRQSRPSSDNTYLPFATTTHSYVSLSGFNK